MSKPCEWCQATSEKIDSLEHELEAKDKLSQERLSNLWAAQLRIQALEDFIRRYRYKIGGDNQGLIDKLLANQ